MRKLKNIVLIENVFAHLRNAGKLLNSRGWKAFRLKLLVSWGTTNPHALNAGDECVSFFNVIQNPKLEETFNSSSIRWSSAVSRILLSACKFRFDAYPREREKCVFMANPESLEWFHLFSTSRAYAWRWRQGRAASVAGTCGKATRVQNAWSI